MVEQFNLRTSKHLDSSLIHHVKISAPIITDSTNPAVNGHIVHSLPTEDTWKSNPTYNNSHLSDDEDVPEILKRLYQEERSAGGKNSSLSDTMSSDVIVNSISNGKAHVCVFVCVMLHSKELTSRCGVCVYPKADF